MPMLGGSLAGYNYTRISPGLSRPGPEKKRKYEKIFPLAPQRPPNTQNATAAAAPTLSESTPGRIGMRSV